LFHRHVTARRQTGRLHPNGNKQARFIVSSLSFETNVRVKKGLVAADSSWMREVSI
jgi:hypothetical protein